jgi:DNA-binding NtrC family response regulator
LRLSDISQSKTSRNARTGLSELARRIIAPSWISPCRLVALAEPGAVLMPEHLSDDIRASRRTIPATERALAPTEFVVRLDQPMPAAMEHVERTMVQHALKVAGGRLEDAAQLLGLSRKGLYLKRQRLGLGDSSTRPAYDGTTATR